MYDWIGSLADNHMHFRLCLQPGVTIQPAELLAHVDRVLQMEVVNTAILMDREDNEISFHRFSAAEVSEENSTSNPTNLDLPLIGTGSRYGSGETYLQYIRSCFSATPTKNIAGTIQHLQHLEKAG